MSIHNYVITLLTLAAVTPASVFRQDLGLGAIPNVGALAEATISGDGAVATGEAALQEAFASGTSEEETLDAAVEAEGASGGASSVEVKKEAGAALEGGIDGMPAGSGGGGGDGGGDQGGQKSGDQGQQGGNGQQGGGQGQDQSGQESKDGGQENQVHGKGQGQGGQQIQGQGQQLRQGQNQLGRGQNGQQSQNGQLAQAQDQFPEGRAGGQAPSGDQGEGQNDQQPQNGQQTQPQDEDPEGRDGSLESSGGRDGDAGSDFLTVPAWLLPGAEEVMESDSDREEFTDTTVSTAPVSEPSLAGPSAPSATTSATTNSTAPTTSVSTSVSRSSRTTLIDPVALPGTLPDVTEEGDDDSVCFPAHATVELRDGSVVRMEELSVGDHVRVGSNKFSEVFMFTHKLFDAKHSFITLRTASGATISATTGHYIYSNGQLAAAGTVRPDDVLTLANGQLDIVNCVTCESARGLFNPQTVHGSIVVSGVLASTYTTAVEPSFAHAVLSPLRVLNWFGLSFTSLESGGGALTKVLPRGERLL